MGRIVPKSSSQGIDTRLIQLDAGEVAVITFAPDKPGGVRGRVGWDNGGVSWILKPQAEGNQISVAVDYSLYNEGDEDWTPHELSPFTAVRQDGESLRIARIRFSNGAGSSAINVSMSSDAKFTAEIL